MAARFDLSAIRKGQAPDPELFPDDIVVVDQASGTGRALLRAVLTSLPIVSVFRPY
jgi:polysaccharide export outer membrane protein